MAVNCRIQDDVVKELVDQMEQRQIPRVGVPPTSPVFVKLVASPDWLALRTSEWVFQNRP